MLHFESILSLRRGHRHQLVSRPQPAVFVTDESASLCLLRLELSLKPLDFGSQRIFLGKVPLSLGGSARVDLVLELTSRALQELNAAAAIEHDRGRALPLANEIYSLAQTKISLAQETILVLCP